jgi:hypothetical protein
MDLSDGDDDNLSYNIVYVICNLDIVATTACQFCGFKEAVLDCCLEFAMHGRIQS